jgi:hypothetical protein
MGEQNVDQERKEEEVRKSKEIVSYFEHFGDLTHIGYSDGSGGIYDESWRALGTQRGCLRYFGLHEIKTLWNDKSSR